MCLILLICNTKCVSVLLLQYLDFLLVFNEKHFWKIRNTSKTYTNCPLKLKRVKHLRNSKPRIEIRVLVFATFQKAVPKNHWKSTITGFWMDSLNLKSYFTVFIRTQFTQTLSTPFSFVDWVSFLSSRYNSSKKSYEEDPLCHRLTCEKKVDVLFCLYLFISISSCWRFDLPQDKIFLPGSDRSLTIKYIFPSINI